MCNLFAAPIVVEMLVIDSVVPTDSIGFDFFELRRPREVNCFDLNIYYYKKNAIDNKKRLLNITKLKKIYFCFNSEFRAKSCEALTKLVTDDFNLLFKL